MGEILQPLVIAIAAVSGGGKTTVTNHLKNNLENTEALFFDSYELEGPDDYGKWIEEGSDPNAWDITPLVNDLKLFLQRPLSYVF